MFQNGLVWGVSWLWYVVGTVGIGGAVLLFTIGPPAVVALVPALLRFFTGTRLGVGLAAAAIAFMVADIHRSRSDAAWWEAEKIRMVEAHKARVAEIAKETREQVRRELEAQQSVNNSIDRDVKDFTDAVPPVPHVVEPGSDPYRVGDAACRLRNIAGYPGCEPRAGSERTNRVQKARPRSARPRAEHQSEVRLPDFIRRGFGRTEQGKPGD